MSALTRALELAQAAAEGYRPKLTHRAEMGADDPTDTSLAEDAGTPRPAGSTTQQRQSTRRSSPKPPRTPS